MKATRQLLSLCLVIGMIQPGYSVTISLPAKKGIPTTFADCQPYLYNTLSSGSGG